MEGFVMKKIHLDIYKETRQYLYLFDVLMKDEIINKDYFLADLGINPGSYRRAKVTEQKIGKESSEIALNDAIKYCLENLTFLL